MLLIASSIFWPSARTPSAISNEIEVALLSSRTRATVPSRISRTIGCSASERAEAERVSRQVVYRVQEDPAKAEVMLNEWGM